MLSELCQIIVRLALFYNLVQSQSTKNTKQPTALHILKEVNPEGYNTVRTAISHCIASCVGVTNFDTKCPYDRLTGSSFAIIHGLMSTCIGQCLGISNLKEPCQYERNTGLTLGGACQPEFSRPTATDRKVICIYEKKDEDKGLTLEALIESGLCSKIIVLVTVKYSVKNPEPGVITVVDKEWHSEAKDFKTHSVVSLFYKIGSITGSTESNQPTEFTKTFSMVGSRSKWITAIIDLTKKPESDPYEGLYIRWLYPGCPNDDCKVGPASDEHRLVEGLKELYDGWKKSFPSRKWEIAMEISAKPDNVYMGLGIHLMSKSLDYFFTMNYEWVEPKPTKVPKTGFQTPFIKNNQSIDNILKKGKSSNKQVFYGVTATLINFVLEEVRGKKPVAPANYSLDELNTNPTLSSFIPFPDACQAVLDKNNKFTIITPKSEEKTSFARNETNFIPFDDTNDILKKVNRIYSTFNRLGGVWMKDISNDDVSGVCKCGKFPTLRAANEGLYGMCTLKNCFQPTK